MKLREMGQDMPAGILLMSPWADLAAQGPSHQENLYRDPMFGIPKGDPIPSSLKAPRYAGDADLFDPFLSPVYGTFEQFPPMLIQVGTEEMLASDSQTVYEKAMAAGVEAKLTVYHGMFHMFQMTGDLMPESRKAWQEAERFLAGF
jgi:epsilon-lactone hydrolase